MVALIAIAVIVGNFSGGPVRILSWDVFGYYLYLPAAFIYRDLGLQHFDVTHQIIDKYHNSGTFYQAMQLPSGYWVMKYSMGLAVLYLPFFLIGHVIALLTSYPADGFSAPYQISILIGGIIYTLVGIYFLRKLLLKFFGDKLAAAVLVIVFFGTNYFFHTSFDGQNAMTHNYLFTLYVFILLLTIKWHETHKLKHILLLALVCGLAILSRPSEAVCLFIPLLWGVGDKNSFWDKVNLLKKHKYQIALFALVLFLIGMVQFTYWKIYTGKFLYYSYGGNAGEGFEFFHPYIAKVLFSFRKGWLIYTPIMFFSVLGLISIYRKNKFIFYSIFIYFIANLYIVSSWTCWWYAQSFSERSLIQSYAVLALPMGYFVQSVNSRKAVLRILCYTLFVLLIALNLFQTWQIKKGIIDGSRMTKAYYMAIFGKTSVSDEDRKLLLVSRAFDGKEHFTETDEYNKRLLDFKDFESGQIDNADTLYAFSGKQSYQMDEQHLYSPAIEAPYSRITDQYYAWIRGSVMVYPVVDPQSNPASLVICFDHNGYSYKYKTQDFEKLDLKLNQWNKVSFDYMTPEVRTTNDKLKVYVWLRGKDALYIDDLKVEVFEPKQP